MSPSATSWMLFFHVLAALWLAAGVFSGAVVRAQGRRATTLTERVGALRIGWRMANIYSLPGAIVAGILGFGLIQARGWTFETRWIQVSIVLWVLMLANGVLYIRPILRRLLAAAEASAAAGAPTAELTRLAAAKGPRIAADLNALALVVLTWLMVMKPF
jgi:uncharacterized membrane protein